MIAFCFPGQGSQEVGMGRDLAAAVPAARAVFERADEVLGEPLSATCWEGPLERLSATEVTQPALTATALACLAAVREAGVAPDVVIGHSVGEYAALAAAGMLDPDDAIRLTRQRGIATADAARATPGAMAALLGLDDAVVEDLCAGIEGVWPANYNCPGQIVVSGTEAGVEALLVAASAAGARRAVRLNVSGGFHSPAVAAAGPLLRPALEATAFAPPRCRFFSTVTCDLVDDPAAMPEILVRQLTAPVLFTQAVRSLVGQGVDTFVEIGAGNVLAGLVRRIDRSLTALSVNSPDGLAKLEAVRGA